MADNLKANKYADGTPIPFVETSQSWHVLADSSKAYCYFDHNDSIGNIYGPLYTWAAAMNGDTSSGAQDVCPAGWHLPSDEEWKQLEIYLGMSQEVTDDLGSRGTTEGGKLKESGYLHWYSPNEGATNEYGFTALPGGWRKFDGEFDYLSEYAYFWTSSEKDGDEAWFRELTYNGSKVLRLSFLTKFGFSVRCLRDSATYPLTIEFNSSNSSSISSNDGAIDIELEGGIPPYSVNWSNGSTEEDISGLYPGVYSVIVSDSRDSIVTDSVRIYATFVDKRDSTRYKAVTIGDQLWMAENLNIGEFVESNYTGSDHSEVSDNGIIEKYALDNDTANCDIYGGLYDWNEMMQYSEPSGSLTGNVQGVCPTGWHIPTDTEFKNLESYLGMESAQTEMTGWRGTNEGGKLKETDTIYWDPPNAGATNGTGFSALPGGSRDVYGNFSRLGMDGRWWSSSEYFEEVRIYSMGNDTSAAFEMLFDRESGLYVRCTRDIPDSLYLIFRDTAFNEIEEISFFDENAEYSLIIYNPHNTPISISALNTGSDAFLISDSSLELSSYDMSWLL